MRNKLFLICAALAVLGTACSHGGDEPAPFDFNNTCWFDGYEFFVGSADSVSDGVFNFEGGTLHEGGSTFALRQVGVDTFVVQPMAGKGWTAVGVAGDTAVREPWGEMSIVVCHREDDPEWDTLWQYDPGTESPKEAYGRLLVKRRLADVAGVYVDEKTNTTYRFDDTLLVRTTAKGAVDTQSIALTYMLDMPTHVLSLSSGELMWYELTEEGIDLFRVTYDRGEDEYVRNARLASLRREE